MTYIKYFLPLLFVCFLSTGCGGDASSEQNGEAHATASSSTESKEELEQKIESARDQIKAGEYQKAEDMLTSLIQSHSEMPALYFHRARARAYAKKLPLACEDFQKYMDVMPSVPDETTQPIAHKQYEFAVSAFNAYQCKK